MEHTKQKDNNNTNIEARTKLVVITNTKPKKICGDFVGGGNDFTS
jgi:hypothetical protein